MRLHGKNKRRGEVITLPEGGPFLSRDPLFYKNFLILLMMIALQQLAAFTVNLVDNIMLGRYSELALSGATLVNQVQFVLHQVAAGVGTGAAVLGSQYWGRGKIEPIRRIMGIAVKFGFTMGLLFFLVGRFAPHGLLSLLTNDETVIGEGMRYLRLMCWTYLLYSVSNTLMYCLQSVETAFIGTIMSISTILINVVLNYCFIYGNWGCPELGIRGAAVATLVSRSVELVIILVYLLFVDKKLQARLRDLLRFDVAYLRDFARASLPVMVTGFMWGIAQGAQTAVLGRLGSAVIAASSIAVTVFQLFGVLGMSAANAASVTMGKTVGQGNYAAIKPNTRSLQLIFLGCGLLGGFLIFISRNFIVDFYAVSEEAKVLARQFLLVMSITCVGSCYEFPCEGGIICGGGDPKYQAIMDNLFMWLFTIPAAALGAFVFHASPLVVFLLLKLDQLLKCIPNGIVTNRYRWVRSLTKQDSMDSTL